MTAHYQGSTRVHTERDWEQAPPRLPFPIIQVAIQRDRVTIITGALTHFALLLCAAMLRLPPTIKEIEKTLKQIRSPLNQEMESSYTKEETTLPNLVYLFTT